MNQLILNFVDIDLIDIYRTIKHFENTQQTDNTSFKKKELSITFLMLYRTSRNFEIIFLYIDSTTESGEK